MTDYSALNNKTSIGITHGFNKQAILWELKYIILPILVLIFVFFVVMIGWAIYKNHVKKSFIKFRKRYN